MSYIGITVHEVYFFLGELSFEAATFVLWSLTDHKQLCQV